jgi:glycine cleavage system transcriptional repressor
VGTAIDGGDGMKKWYMVTLVGRDQPGIVAGVAQALYAGRCNLGEASMARLGGNFATMLMVEFDGEIPALEAMLEEVSGRMGLRCHVDAIEAGLHCHIEPDVRISVYGADRAGIVAEVTGALAEAGLNILNLETDIGGTEENPIYIMHLDGVAGRGAAALRSVLETLSREKNVEARLVENDLLMG